MGKYDDIIGLPHHVSATRPQMSRANRAAQFSPFAALTGYDAAVIETARLTERKTELSEEAIAELDMKLNMLADMIDSQSQITITHFVPDTKKDGGSYIATTGTIKRIDGYERVVMMAGGEKIEISNILNIDSEIFNTIDRFVL
jgi:hypothetical protein